MEKCVKSGEGNKLVDLLAAVETFIQAQQDNAGRTRDEQILLGISWGWAEACRP